MTCDQTFKPDDRLSHRRPVFLNARCRRSSWIVQQVELADISEGGCRIVGSAEGLKVGQHVVLRIADKPGIKGHVRWSRGGDAGIAFAQTADSDIIENLAETYRVAGGNVTDIRKYR